MIDESRAAANRQAREEKKKAHLRAIMDRYMEQFRAAGDRDAPSVARAAHVAIEAVLERDRNQNPASGDIKCRKGCSYCCHEPVEVWPHEAALLVEIARETGMNIDRARLERQGRHTIDTWRQQPVAERACVFLGKDSTCTVYASRPNACRKLLVLTDPELCNGAERAPDSVGRWFSWEAEILESAALEVFGAALLPQLVLAELLKDVTDKA